MRAELKFIDFTGDVLDKNDAYIRAMQDEYCLPLCLAIGSDNSEGSHYFYVNVFNVGFIRKRKFFINKKSIIVDTDDFDEIVKHLHSFIKTISGDNWDDIVQQLREYFYWEYE